MRPQKTILVHRGKYWSFTFPIEITARGHAAVYQGCCQLKRFALHERNLRGDGSAVGINIDNMCYDIFREEGGRNNSDHQSGCHYYAQTPFEMLFHCQYLTFENCGYADTKCIITQVFVKINRNK